MKKTKTLFSILFLILLMIIFIPNNVYAASYEWYSDGSFEIADEEYIIPSTPHSISGFYENSAGIGYVWNEDNHPEMSQHTGSYSLLVIDQLFLKYDIPLMDSGDYQNLSLWVYRPYVDTDGWTAQPITVRMEVWYSNSYMEYFTSDTITDYSTWTQIVFDDALVDSDHYITQINLIRMSPYGDGGQIWDDLSLKASSENSQFTWYLTPTPVSITNQTATIFKGLDYTFWGTVGSGEDGTFQITTNGARGILGTSNIYDGLFNLTMPPHTTGLDADSSEWLNVSVTVSEPFWVYLHFTYLASESPTDESGSISDNAFANSLLSWVILGAVLIAPSFVIAGYGTSISPTLGLIGFMAGLTIMGGIALYIGLMDICLMFLIIIADMLIFFGLLKGRDG